MNNETTNELGQGSGCEDGNSVLNDGLGITCPDCNGTGRKEDCEECENTGWVEDIDDGGTMTCEECNGRSGESCETCNGDMLIYPNMFTNTLGMLK